MLGSEGHHSTPPPGWQYSLYTALSADAVNSTIRSDDSAVMGFTVGAGAIFIVANLLVDIAHTSIDPRERAG